MNTTLALVPLASALACAAVILMLLRRPEWLPLDPSNERPLHEAPVHRVGGIGIVAGVLLAFALLRAEPLLAALVAALAVVSFLDDRSHPLRSTHAPCGRRPISAKQPTSRSARLRRR